MCAARCAPSRCSSQPRRRLNGRRRARRWVRADAHRHGRETAIASVERAANRRWATQRGPISGLDPPIDIPWVLLSTKREFIHGELRLRGFGSHGQTAAMIIAHDAVHDEQLGPRVLFSPQTQATVSRRVGASATGDGGDLVAQRSKEPNARPQASFGWSEVARWSN
jgi:hypothetical protein